MDLHGQHDQEEPMDYDSAIMEEEESADAEEQNLFGLGGKDLFEQEDPAPPSPASLYDMD